MGRAWLALAAAALASAGQAEFKPGEGWLPLFSGKDLAGWKAVGRYKSEWRAEGGLLANPVESDNLYTEKEFENFRLHLEFKLPKGGNSGVYLRGRKEIQVMDSFGREKPGQGDCGGIYSKAAPTVNACKPAGEWNSFDITIVGDVITVTHNGKLIQDKVELKGCTGGALDGDDTKPGALMMQGDHTSVSYRNIWIKPLTEEKK